MFFYIYRLLFEQQKAIDDGHKMLNVSEKTIMKIKLYRNRIHYTD